MTRIRRSDENGREETGNCLQFLLKFLLFPTHTKKKISNSDHNNHRVYKYIINFSPFLFHITLNHMKCLYTKGFKECNRHFLFHLSYTFKVLRTGKAAELRVRPCGRVKCFARVRPYGVSSLSVFSVKAMLCTIRSSAPYHREQCSVPI